MRSILWRPAQWSSAADFAVSAPAFSATTFP
jgi:hypothetical protein